MTQGLIVVTHAGQGGLRERAALRRLINSEDVRTALIFCSRKRDVGVLHRSLTKHGYDVGLLHGIWRNRSVPRSWIASGKVICGCWSVATSPRAASTSRT